MAWFSAGPQSNPADLAVLADTGAVAGGKETRCVVVVTASAQESVILERRDAANATTVNSQFIRVPPNDTRSVDMGQILLANNERLRVLQSGALVGLVHASITF